jgi:hypothetical protein
VRLSLALGATGTMASAVVALAMPHDVVKVGYYEGDFHVDFTSPTLLASYFTAAAEDQRADGAAQEAAGQDDVEAVRTQ